MPVNMFVMWRTHRTKQAKYHLKRNGNLILACRNSSINIISCIYCECSIMNRHLTAINNFVWLSLPSSSKLVSMKLFVTDLYIILWFTSFIDKLGKYRTTENSALGLSCCVIHLPDYVLSKTSKPNLAGLPPESNHFLGLGFYGEISSYRK